jgi:hypothetical protein
MTATPRRLPTLVALLSVVTIVRAGDETLTRVQIARLGKAATALVEVKAARGQGHASAFCIHPAGWFLTNAHVAQGELTLVLNPSLKTEKAYQARVVRSDTELDLALLHVEGVKDLPALALGSDEGLEEQMDAMAFGFPLVESSSTGREGYPSISVNSGSITALRRQEGRLKEIQLDAELNPGNSGGPVLDSRGKVIGVVRSGVVARGLGRTGMNHAIPVSTVAGFLARPEVEFDPPRLGPSGLHKPVRFEARVTALLPSPAPLSVDLILKAGDGQGRTARMEAHGDRHRLTAVPIPGPSGPVTLRLAARFEDGSLEATATDRTFTAGCRQVALADVRTIWPGSPARVSLRNGTIITGALSGLDAVPVPVGRQTLAVKLDGAKVVEVTPVAELERVTCTLVVHQGDKEVYRDTHGLGVAGLLTNPSFEAGFTGWTRLTTKGAQAQFDLDTNGAREGRQSVRISVTQLSDSCIYQDLVLKPGRRYGFSGWVRTRGLNPNGALVYGTFQIQPVTQAYSTNRPNSNHGGDNEWTEVAFSFEAPADGKVRIVPTHVNFGMGTGTVWFDDLKLQEISPAGEPAPSVSAVTQSSASAVMQATNGSPDGPRQLPDQRAPTASAGSQPTNGTLRAPVRGAAWLVVVTVAVLPLTIFLAIRRRRWWRQLQSRWPPRSSTLGDEAAEGSTWATLRSRFLPLKKRRASEELLAASDWKDTARGHPDATILALFAAGRLRSSEMDRLGEHLAECSVCLEVLEQLPEDEMVGMLREHGGQVDESSGKPTGGKIREEKSRCPSGEAPRSTADQGDAGATRASKPVEDVDAERWSPGPTLHPRYKLKRLLGHGSMGLIYLADDREENRPAVLKFLREDLLDRPRMVERFRREAAAATLLKHPNIVEAYGVEPFGRWPALVMEYIRGTDLARLIEKAGPVPIRIGCELIRQAALGLQHSFEQGMVHRDIKPSNLIVSNAGTVKILDFGLAKMQSELAVDAGLTSTGALLGSVDYMAPEQLDDPRLADIRADIYSLGCTLYHLLSGVPPFQGSTLDVLEAHRSQQATPLHTRRPEVRSELAAVVARMIAKEPGRRFQSPVAVARALTPFLWGAALERTTAWNDNAASETEVPITGDIQVE